MVSRNQNNLPDDLGYRDAETLREMYVGKRMSIREVADEFTVSDSTIRRWLGKHDINTRDRHDAHKMKMWEGPAPFDTNSRGYERWKTTIDRESYQVYVHRLLAVAEYGFDAVCGKAVHHDNGIRWDNRPVNIELLELSEHAKLHSEKTDGYIGKNFHLAE